MTYEECCILAAQMSAAEPAIAHLRNENTMVERRTPASKNTKPKYTTQKPSPYFGNQAATIILFRHPDWTY